MYGLVVNQLSKRMHILSFKFPLSQHWEKWDFTQKYISKMVAKEKSIFICVVFQRKRNVILGLQKYTKELIFSWNNTLVADVAYLLSRMLFQRKWGLWFWTAFPFCVCCACFQTSFSWILHVKKCSAAITTHHSIPKIAQRLLFKETRWPSLNVYVPLWGLFISVSSQPYWHFGVLRVK